MQKLQKEEINMLSKLWTQGEKKKELQLTLNRAERLTQITDLVIRGIKIETIAKQFEIDERTVYKDLELIRKQFKENTLTGDMMERITIYNEQQRARIQNLWALYNKPGQSDKQKALLLKQLKEEEELSIKKEQIIGLLPRDNPQTAVQINNNLVMSEEEIKATINRLQSKTIPF